MRSTSNRLIVILGLILAIAATSCAKKSEETSSTTPPPTESTTPAPLNDANIAAIVVAANSADIENGHVASSKTSNAAVKQFAELMVKDHQASNDQAKALVGKLNVTPEDNETSRGLTSSMDATRDSLKSLDGATFDRSYVDHEVAYHQQVVDMLDNTLIPNAQNPELKSLLESTRPVIVAHLDHAKHLQSTMPQ